MHKRHVVVTAALAIACSGKAPPEIPGNPPPPPAELIPPPTNPPMPLPTWEQVPSGHPEGATNPPRAILVVTEEHRCYKRWVSGMMRLPDGLGGDHVEAPPVANATEVQCPEPRATEVLAAAKAGQ